MKVKGIKINLAVLLPILKFIGGTVAAAWTRAWSRKQAAEIEKRKEDAPK